MNRDAVVIPTGKELLNGVAKARGVHRCQLCGGAHLVSVLRLGTSPPPCVMHPVGMPPVVEERYPLELLSCHDCGLVQLSVKVDPEFMFPSDYPYSSGNSPQLHRDFEDLAAEVSELIDLQPVHLVVDIGANDGTLLSKFGGCRKLGVEPTAQARKIKGDYIEAPFSEDVADWIVRAQNGGDARVITACNLLAHVDDLDSVMRGIKHLLAPNGILVVENHDFGSVLAGQWDMVYHEHLRYFTPDTFRTLLNQYDMGCTDWRPIGTHGGSFRMIATHGMHGNATGAVSKEALSGLQEQASGCRTALRQALIRNAPVVGIGAAARGTTILNYCGLDVEDVEAVVEVPGSDKIGSYIPGTRIPVVPEDYLLNSDRPGLLLSWHLADIIIPKLRESGYVNPIIVPLPELYYEVSATDALESHPS